MNAGEMKIIYCEFVEGGIECGAPRAVSPKGYAKAKYCEKHAAQVRRDQVREKKVHLGRRKVKPKPHQKPNFFRIKYED